MAAPGEPLVLARHYVRLHQFERALEVLGRVTSAELDEVEVWRLRAAALHGLRRYEEALRAADSGLARRADDLVLLDQLALSAFEGGKRRKAQAALRRALALDPGNALLIAHGALFLARTKGSVLTRRWRRRKAQVSADLAVRLAPESLPVLRIRASVAALTGDRRASAFKRQLLAVDPGDKAVRLISGAVSVRRGEISEALEHYVEAARLDPGDHRTAWLGRRSRALLRPGAAPLRLLWRLGPRRVHVAVIVLSMALLTVHASTVRAVLLTCWVAVVLYAVAIRVGLRLRFGRRPR